MALVSIGTAAISSILLNNTSVTDNMTGKKFYALVKTSPNFSTIENYTAYNLSILSTYASVVDKSFTTIATPKFSGTGLYYYSTESYTLPTSYIFWS